MTSSLNWLSVQPAFEWLNTRTGTGLTNVPTHAPVFLLSRDPVETLTQRVAGRHYIATEKLPDCFETTNTFAPQDRDATPNRLELTDTGLLRLLWSPSVPETIYPASDTSAELTQGPIQSFAVWIGEFSATQNSSGYYSRNRIAIAERYAKGPILFLTGTVGPKGSGADLELEAIEDWRPGRPIYLPGNELTLPFRVVRGMDHSPAEAGSWERDGPHGNIAVPGLNGLTNASFSASANSGGAYRAFNGWQGRRKTRASASQDEWDTRWGAETDFIGRDEDGWRKVEHWLQVDFGKVVTNLSSLCLRSAPIDRYGKPDRRWQSPYRFRVQTSKRALSISRRSSLGALSAWHSTPSGAGRQVTSGLWSR